eukprot:TRINITY_DN12670_c12_g1_i2.p2 TRINITY_DN12670_c12_g1~~TRINITY_DN12670_c12_g1_i2.p2  ORF type:complete len:182 (-),score=15.72 TRINITY_DN12670_c12_g1_i2:141-686(-)
MLGTEKNNEPQYANHEKNENTMAEWAALTCRLAACFFATESTFDQFAAKTIAATKNINAKKPSIATSIFAMSARCCVNMLEVLSRKLMISDAEEAKKDMTPTAMPKLAAPSFWLKTDFPWLKPPSEMTPKTMIANINSIRRSTVVGCETNAIGSSGAPMIPLTEPEGVCILEQSCPTLTQN